MIDRIRPATRPLTCALALTVVAAMFQAAHADLRAAGPTDAVQAPNYVLASQWTTEKISKVVFDLGVEPHWLETGDRFWYSFETRDGKRYLPGQWPKGEPPIFDPSTSLTQLDALPPGDLPPSYPSPAK